LKDSWSVEQICEEFFRLENEYGLLDLEIGGVKLWQLTRMSIYYQVAMGKDVFSEPHPHPEASWCKVVQFLKSFSNLLLRNPFFVREKIDVLVVPHVRKVKYNNEYVDIYSHYLVDQLTRNGQNCLLLEKDCLCGVQIGGSRRSVSSDIILWLNKFDNFFSGSQISEEEKAYIDDLHQLLNNTFEATINFRDLFSKRLRNFYLKYRCYKVLLNRLQPKKIYVVVAYFGWGELTKAAKDLGIEVVEIQHGVYSRYHLGYSYPGRTKALDFFPDKMLTWGSYWSEMSELPLDRSALVDYGFKYFHLKRELLTRIERVGNQILILSQGALSQRLAYCVLGLADQLLDYQIVYKLHPSEYATWRQQELLQKLSAMPNVVIAAEGSDLYELLAESTYQFGVFSTAIFEGIGMGCKTVLLDLPGIEYMERLILKRLCVKHDSGSEIRMTMEKADDLQEVQLAEQLFNVGASVSV
jgi:hypothetical protein